MNAIESFRKLYAACCWTESLVTEMQGKINNGELIDLKKLNQIRENLNEAKRAERELRKALK
jgi:hypothetical protein